MNYEQRVRNRCYFLILKSEFLRLGMILASRTVSPVPFDSAAQNNSFTVTVTNHDRYYVGECHKLTMSHHHHLQLRLRNNIIHISVPASQ